MADINTFIDRLTNEVAVATKNKVLAEVQLEDAHTQISNLQEQVAKLTEEKDKLQHIVDSEIHNAQDKVSHEVPVTNP